MDKLSPKWTLRPHAWTRLALCALVAAGAHLFPSARGQNKLPALAAEKLSPLTISCVAQPSTIKLGGSARIVATASSAQHRPLSFVYSASSGSVSGNGATALFLSAGASAGIANISCRVSDDQGRTASAIAAIVIGAPAKPTILHTPTTKFDLHIPPSDLSGPPLIQQGLTSKGTSTGSSNLAIQTKSITLPGPIIEPPPPGGGGNSSTPVAAQNLTIQSAPTPSNEYAEGYALEDWKKGLKQGRIEYQVPQSMSAQTPASVTVRVHGFQDAVAEPLLGATGSDTLKVSSFMKVELLAPLNPGEFTITSGGNQAVQFVPIDGSATWNWTVTPAYEAKNQQLEIRVSLVYKRPDMPLEDLLEDKNYAVNVDVQKLTTTLWQGFQKDPIGFIKYMMPGGAGWGALAALVTSLGGLAWWKRKSKKKAARNSHAHRTNGS